MTIYKKVLPIIMYAVVPTKQTAYATTLKAGTWIA